METYSVKLSFRILCSAVLSLLLALLKILRSSGACVFCHVALAFLLKCHKTLDCRGDIVYWYIGFAFRSG